jgi:hypothetical protein
MNKNSQILKNHNFSTAFERMCSIVAIGKTKGVEDTLKELILYCLVFLPEDVFQNANEFSIKIHELFGLKIAGHEIQFAIDQLLSIGTLIKSENKFAIPDATRRLIRDSIDSAYILENKVRDGWQAEISSSPDLDFPKIWRALRRYLSNAFQRHGIQTVSLLDPSIDIPQDYTESLSSILDGVIASEFPEEQRPNARQVISDFMATTGNYATRAKYIAQLADGAFNYFALAIAPTSAAEFRKGLNPIMLFFDTNFLFGVLDLDVSPQVAISNELLSATKKYNLPFQFRSHERTVRELLASINKYADDLGARQWSRSISRAATTSRYLSGVELRYHQRFAQDGIDVESFFKPYRHADVILKEKSVVVYNPKEERLKERADLIQQYSEFLRKRNKVKPYKIIDHDMTVLDVVRQLRSKASSTLEAGALFITCDYTLYKFDWETSKNTGSPACTVLPSTFWQVIRPFIPSDEEFDRSFADTFAIPEFRIIGSHAAEACSKMLNILAGYKDVTEETAIKMLSNDLLIERLQTAENDNVFQEYVESEIVRENQALLEENARIKQHLENEKEEKINAEQKLETEKSIRQQHELELQDTYAVIHQKTEEAEIEKAARISAEQRASDAEKTVKKEKEINSVLLGSVLGTIVSFVGVLAFELTIHLLKWEWLITHSHALGLQIAFDILLALLSYGIFVPKWRKVLWPIGIIPLIYTIIQII